MPKLRTLPEIPVSRVGGHLGLDFLNTVDWRLDPARRSDRLTGLPELLAWAVIVELVTPGEVERVLALAETDPEQAIAEHSDVVALREDCYAALTDAPDRSADSVPVTLVARLRGTADRFTLVRDPTPAGPWRWDSEHLTLQTPGDRIARTMLELCTDPVSARVRRCDDDSCGWVFIDTSRNSTRRWCCSATCGNRNRVRRHYDRATRRGQGPW